MIYNAFVIAINLIEILIFLFMSWNIKQSAVIKNSSAYWEGKSDAETLQRVYGISFPDPKMLKEWQKIQVRKFIKKIIYRFFTNRYFF